MNKLSKFLFGDIVVVDKNRIGVILKTWEHHKMKSGRITYTYDVFVKDYNEIKEYKEKDIERYRVRRSYLNVQEVAYQKGEL